MFERRTIMTHGLWPPRFLTPSNEGAKESEGYLTCNASNTIVPA